MSDRQRAKLLFFWDYDTQWGGDRSRSNGGPKNWGHLEFENTERLLELHAEFRVPACFAVVGSAALPGQRPYHDPDQVRRIHAHGHEVASHSHRHEWLPGLDHAALQETLSSSKDALEQCIGARVSTFVPPYNQPFDYPRGLSFSLAERREARGDRTGLSQLCETLHDTGYRFCRVAYQPVHLRLAQYLPGRPWEPSCQIEMICGISCVRLTGPSGFAAHAQNSLQRCIQRKSIGVVYGHPHSLTLGNTQDEKWLKPFLESVHSFDQQGLLEVVLPRQLSDGQVGRL